MEETARAFQPDTDVHITYIDQQKINLFARLNARYDDIKAELKAKENELNNVDEASNELLLMDDDEEQNQIPFMSGDAFLYMTVPEARDALDETKNKLLSEIQTYSHSMDSLKEEMSSLKSQLYGKFGTHINLENDEE